MQDRKKKALRRDEVLQILAEHREEIKKFGVKSLAVFGSVARGEAGPESDVDILVDFSRPVGLFEFVRLKLHLEKLLGGKVDLVTLDAIRPVMRERILREAIHAT